jgi:hypothetical protein
MSLASGERFMNLSPRQNLQIGAIRGPLSAAGRINVGPVNTLEMVVPQEVSPQSITTSA